MSTVRITCSSRWTHAEDPGERAPLSALERHRMFLEDAPPGRPGQAASYIRLRELVNAKHLRLPPQRREATAKGAPTTGRR